MLIQNKLYICLTIYKVWYIIQNIKGRHKDKCVGLHTRKGEVTTT